MEKTELKPAIVFHYFEEVCRVPRPSKKEEKIRTYLLNFAKEHGLSAKTDDAGNVLIEKAASPGKENLKKVILQSHMDMVCEKNNDTQHNFETDPIDTYIDGEWLRAKGTTLGADNGIGIAAELAILASDDIEHGPIQCVFTVDEETGLTGAFSMKEGFMDGDILINLDSEDEDELFIGCAGGAGTTAKFPCSMIAAPEGYFFFRVTVKGLTGGHSGDDINKNRANANKILNRYLVQLMQNYDLRLCEIDGGNLHNAIPREAYALCAVPMSDKEAVRVDLNIYLSDVENEFAVTEPNLQIELESESPCAQVMDAKEMKRFFAFLFCMVPLVWSGCSKDDQAPINASKLIGTWELTKDYDGEDDYWDYEYGEEFDYVFTMEFREDGTMTTRLETGHYTSRRNYVYTVKSNMLTMTDDYDPEYPEVEVARILKLTSTELVLAYDYRGDNGRTCTDKEYYKRID